MTTWLTYSMVAVVLVLASTALFFFTLTRGALIMRGALGRLHHEAAHVYPIYSNMRLIRLVDYQPIIAAILLFQYSRLVSLITHGLHHTDLRGQQVLITSCAFGNVMPRVVKAALKSGARKVLVADIIQNELDHARRKLGGYAGQVDYRQDNAIAMQLPDGSVDANVMFFLLHELPHHLKGEALKEAMRVLAPGGKLYLAEFHRPRPSVLRALSWTYFKVFEPYGLALWNTHDPVLQLSAMPGVRCERHVVFFGNFQVIVATKGAAD
ncbi:class I SAM-dependent methyltransferase [Rhodoferax sp.]|uniref:class I SAM-dependent methyltransferase n=1 Tax=Rhodoferax sp. TaxID=50421 RepID=UPI00260C2DE0|nr:class I SAM-dependent methyltransferase [Rhodoferax sp.]MDD2924347.1 class I SAM-dependent methyltransferase [Rhodoferax sp.]